MNIYEETICDSCNEKAFCRRTDCVHHAAWTCEDCHYAEQLEAQAAIDAEFENMRYRLTPKGEQLLARLAG